MRFFGDAEPQSALFRRVRLSSPGQTWRHLTEKRSLHVGPHGKAQSAVAARRKSAFSNRRLTEKRILQPAPHGKAHSARQQSPRVRLFVRVRPRVRFSVECAFPHLGKRGATSRKSAFWSRRLTEKRTLQPTSHGKPHSAIPRSHRPHLSVTRHLQTALFRDVAAPGRCRTTPR